MLCRVVVKEEIWEDLIPLVSSLYNLVGKSSSWRVCRSRSRGLRTSLNFARRWEELVFSSDLANTDTPIMADPKTYTATCSAPVNIAVIKYWGKRDTSLILPTNDSLSVTLDQDHLRSVTTASASAAFEQGDRLWLNGIEEQIKDSKRLLACIQECRKVRKSREEADASLAKVCLSFFLYGSAHSLTHRIPRCPTYPSISVLRTTSRRQQVLHLRHRASLPSSQRSLRSILSNQLFPRRTSLVSPAKVLARPADRSLVALLHGSQAQAQMDLTASP